MPYTLQVIKIIKSIPEGYVMSYGQIAELAGSARGARQVVRILHSMSKTYELPWHRVVNAKGQIAIMDDESRFQQILYLRDEGVVVDDSGQIELDNYRFVPKVSSLSCCDNEDN
jgi:methylated-DNA-protein-cysteine methyltransferase-like protein